VGDALAAFVLSGDLMKICVVLKRTFDRLVWLAVLAAGLAAPACAHADTLDDVKKRGSIACGVADQAPGLSMESSNGTWSGLSIDYCRALAAAVLGSKDAVRFVALKPADRIKALTSGTVDVLSGSTPWTLSFDSDLGIRFAGVLFYDGQGFLAKRTDVVASIFELSGSTICLTEGTSAEKLVTDFFIPRQMKFQAVMAPNWSDVVKAYLGTGCTVLTGDVSVLAHERSLFNRPADHILLPELVSKLPLGPAVRSNDERWFAVARWTLMALLSAEELGVTSENAQAMRTSEISDIQRLLGVETNLGEPLGLNADWAFQAIHQVGNYGELFDRSLGTRSELKLERGFNALWTKGGLMFAAPFR
jgi:general L-amino acid transport system substrate-binding protein